MTQDAQYHLEPRTAERTVCGNPTGRKIRQWALVENETGRVCLISEGRGYMEKMMRNAEIVGGFDNLPWVIESKDHSPESKSRANEMRAKIAEAIA